MAHVNPAQARRRRLFESLIQDGQLAYIVLDEKADVVFASDAVSELFGWDPVDTIGRNGLTFIHPDEVERAVVQLGGGFSSGIARGFSVMRVLHEDGSVVPAEIWASPVTDGENSYLCVYARDGRNQAFLSEITTMLLDGAPRSEILSRVLNTIQWQGLGSMIAIEWIDSAGVHQVVNGEQVQELAGSGLISSNSSDPWSRSRDAMAAVRGTVDDCDALLRTAAGGANLHSYWVEAIRWSDEYQPATLTAWTAPGVDPAMHMWGMGAAKSFIELILRWTEHVHEMDIAARYDPLTGLHNRRALLSTLESSDGPGSILYCDLNGFKPVNDSLGHGAGDDLLGFVAKRLLGCVRDTDVVARMGGDEFVVYSPGTTDADADAMATRIRAAIGKPFALGEVEITIGISVGVASTEERLNRRTLDDADRRLVAEKGRAR